jgi:hypothetical protein
MEHHDLVGDYQARAGIDSREEARPGGGGPIRPCDVLKWEAERRVRLRP